MSTLCVEFHEDDQWLGGSIYIDNLLAALSVLPSDQRPDVRLAFLSSSKTALAKRLLAHSAVEQNQSAAAYSNSVAKLRRLHRASIRRWPRIGRFFRARGDEVYFPVFDVTQRWRRNLYWIPDFQPLYFPALFEARELGIRTKSMADIAGSTGLLLLSSNAAMNDFRSFYPEATVMPRVWSFCSSLEPASQDRHREVLQRYDLPRKFLYIANHFWKHKDHETAFRALKLLSDRGEDIFLVCTGLQADRRNPGHFESLVQALETWGLQDRVRFLGVVPREDQLELFRMAAAVLQPSRFEGWSTVIEDAKALGRPMIVSDIAVHTEQVEGLEHARLFKTSDAEDLAGAISDLWPTLTPGPQLDLEQEAVKRRNSVRIEAARKFVAIVEEAVAFSRTV
ncbi:glycosyl transferase [Rhizobium sp. R635]|uniref:glycosyltransferase family 4 protein n=1 Tax=Rhizobium sp. R635 TaxID=1764275 RepID=UPI000B5387B8|nr:glycosyltransferase family 1 protein [Rhizobium sp. R635]OWV92180.1 glycosyl transferase [Rhizobium sp. R635]